MSFRRFRAASSSHGSSHPAGQRSCGMVFLDLNGYLEFIWKCQLAVIYEVSDKFVGAFEESSVHVPQWIRLRKSEKCSIGY